jgi:hypothetical protein
MTIDVVAELPKAAASLQARSQAPQGCDLPKLEAALGSAFTLFQLLMDCDAPDGEVRAAAERVAALARRRADHPDADEAAPRALALERGAVALRTGARAREAPLLSAEAAERWVEAAEDIPARAKEFFLRASDNFVASGQFDRAAGVYARAIRLGEDSFELSRAVHPSMGAHRLKLEVLLLAAGKDGEARAINDALIEELTSGFEKKVPRGEFDRAIDRARALAEAHLLAGNRAGERQARLGAIDLALALSKREAKAARGASAAEVALSWADVALTEALKTRDDALFLETFRRAARGTLDGALAALENPDNPGGRPACVRLLFEAGRRFQSLGESAAADECFARAYEISPKYSPPDRRPADEMAMALFLLKARTPDAERAEVHLKNAQALAKALIQAAGVHEDHPSARLRQMALKEAFYRRMGNLRKHAETVEIMAVAATEGAAAALEKAAVKYNAGAPREAREFLDEGAGYLERAGLGEDLLVATLRARSLCYWLAPEGEPPETVAAWRDRKSRSFDPRALGFDWRRIQRALLEMDPPAEFQLVSDELHFIKGRAPKEGAAAGAGAGATPSLA